MATWRGVYPAVMTQFSANGAVDTPATLRHIDALLAAGVHGVILLGTLGENSSLEPAEKRELVTAVVQNVGKRAPVLAGVAECSTSAACCFATDCAKAGVDGLMVLPAMVYKADAREAAAHFRAVAAASDRPIMIYNNPVSYGVDLSPEALAELADEPKFVAIKESSDDVRRITDIKNLCGDRYALFCGVDDLALEATLLGADGWVAGLVNAFPKETVQIWELAKVKRIDEALKLYRWFMPMLHLDTHVKLVQYIKLAVQEVGLGRETVRLPRLPLVGAERERVLAVIRRGIETRPCE
jgi:dihydrodipicolinate synthase/N-acetylneuraminate lyase